MELLPLAGAQPGSLCHGGTRRLSQADPWLWYPLGSAVKAGQAPRISDRRRPRLEQMLREMLHLPLLVTWSLAQVMLKGQSCYLSDKPEPCILQL